MSTNPPPTSAPKPRSAPAKRLSRADRIKRLARVKEAIECSEYENSLKLSVAVDRLLDHLKK